MIHNLEDLAREYGLHLDDSDFLLGGQHVNGQLRYPLTLGCEADYPLHQTQAAVDVESVSSAYNANQSSPSPAFRYSISDSQPQTGPSIANYSEQPRYGRVDGRSFLENDLPPQRRPPWAPANTTASYPYSIDHQPNERKVIGDSGISSRPGPVRGQEPLKSAQGIQFVPVSNLPDVFRGVFKFGVFNAIQSTCYDTVMNTNDNVVITAPTGGGKTAIFELALVRMLQLSADGSQKMVYLAPTKALCSERMRDWESKFTTLGVRCAELTGDTASTYGKNAWGEAKNASIIISTAEKWDSLTRSWNSNTDILSRIKLFCVDEVHVLNELSRGSTLEAVVSRMKMRGTALRFVIVSATMPNIDDIANWVGRNGTPSGANSSAHVFEFDESYRPCPLNRVVYGYPKPANMNDFVFQRQLDHKLFSLIQIHSEDKPILVFCSTRKGTVDAAETLCKEYEKMKGDASRQLPWTAPKRVAKSFDDKRLERLADFGIGVHNAGITLDDRRLTEELFLNKTLRVLCATSTLAVGVNLPAHLVVIKGVKVFRDNMYVEMSALDVIQMMGRAGRPQFDKNGTALIVCESELESKYKTLVSGQTILESSLHRNLAEHLNSEIGLGTIEDLSSARTWLRSTFLYQRIQKNPQLYALPLSAHSKDIDGNAIASQNWEVGLITMIDKSIASLRESGLLEQSGEHLRVTEYGEIMSKYYVRQATVDLILKLPERASVREMLEVLCEAEEMADIRLRGGDKALYNKLRTHPEIRFKIRKIEKSSHKVFILIQAVLGGISLSSPEYKSGDSQPSLEALSIFRHTSRIARVIVEVAISKKFGAQIKHGLELLRCVSTKAWEDRPIVMRQVPQLGDKSIKVLAEHGVTNLQLLRSQEPGRLQLLLNRRPPFGHEILAFVRELPSYILNVCEEEVTIYAGERPVSIDLSVTCGLDASNMTISTSRRAKGLGMTSVLTLTSDYELLDFRRIPTKALTETKTFSITASLSKPSQSIIVHIASETTAGVTLSTEYKANIKPDAFPTRFTRPLGRLQADLAAFEDDPDFWNDDGSDDGVTTNMKPSSSTAKLPMPKANTVDEPTIPKSGVLPNGNFVCNHNCKDKTACRHLCCREGLPKPPIAKKSGDVDRTKSKAGVSRNHANDALVVDALRSKNGKHKVDSILSGLDTLHTIANVQGRLQMDVGARLKLDRTTDSPSKNPWGIAEPIGAGGPSTCAPDGGELDEDLPDLGQVLRSIPRKPTKRGRQTLITPMDRSSSDYGCSTDAKHCAIPSLSPSPPDRVVDERLTSLERPVKRRKVLSYNSLPRKDTFNQLPPALLGSPPATPSFKEPLFLSASDSSLIQSNIPSVNVGDTVAIDPDIIEAVGSTPPQPPHFATAISTLGVSRHSKRSVILTEDQDSEPGQTTVEPSHSLCEEPRTIIMYEDGMDELERWFETDAVEWM